MEQQSASPSPATMTIQPVFLFINDQSIYLALRVSVSFGVGKGNVDPGG
jgi:hypothetical protein